MDSLPPTSYVRMVDIWLIVGQVIPFIEVIILTAKELYVETNFTNHHGFKRDLAVFNEKGSIMNKIKKE